MAKKFNEAAEKYAKPHTMSGKDVTGDLKYTPGAKVLDDWNISVAGISKGNYAAEKTDGIVTRGNGAATKGTKARGPMA
jgi:hypothetical protein